MNGTAKTIIKVIGVVAVVGVSYYATYKFGDVLGKKVTVPAVTKILKW